MSHRLTSRTYRIVLAALFAVACSGANKSKKGDERAGTSTSGGEAVSDEESDGEEVDGLAFELGEVDETEAGTSGRARKVKGEPLSAESIRGLFDAVPAMEEERSASREFSFAGTSKPPPKAGRLAETPFPPAEDRRTGSDAPSEGDAPLQIVRRSPEGEVGIAPRLSVTFSRSMVPLGGAQAGRVAVPVRLQPDVEGTWRWVGTRTVLFEPAGERFPMATEYRAVIPESTRSLDGTSLEEPVEWTFSTPPLRVEEARPSGGPVGLEPLFFLQFNQEIDPEAVLEHVRVWGGGTMYSPRRAADQRVQQNESVAEFVRKAPAGHWLAFYLPRSLQPETSYQFGLSEGAPSAEGERVTRESRYVQFRTFDSLVVERSACGWRQCWPGTPWVFEFNNPIDTETVDASSVRVEPRLEDKSVEVHGDRIFVRGETRPETNYEVTLRDTIRDTFGQWLEKPHEATFEISPAPPRLYRPDRVRTTLDPRGPRRYRVHSTGFRSLHVVARRVSPGDWPAFVEARRNRATSLPGKKVFERTVEVDQAEATFATTAVDLSQALDEGQGHVVLRVEGRGSEKPPGGDPRRGRRSFQVWVQSTELAIDAYVDDRRLVAWTTSLAEGRPLEGVEVSLGSSSESVRTDARGVARLELPEKPGDPWGDFGNIATVTREGDSAFVSEYGAWARGASRWVQRDPGSDARWLVWDDRGLYRPGERLRVKGWLRWRRDGGLVVPSEGTKIEYRLRGPRQNELNSGVLRVDEDGGFDLEVDLPEEVNLGRASLEFRADLDGETVQTRHAVRVQEFRTPSFEVGVDAPAGPHVVGTSFRARLRAEYYAGGDVRAAETRWRVESRSTDYAPPGWEEFVFGTWRPWWFGSNQASGRSKTLEGTTNASGEDVVTIDLESVSPPRPHELTLHGSVTDVNRQTYSGSERVVVHPSETYVGLKTDRWFVEADDPIEVEAVATDIGGDTVKGRKVEIEAERLDWAYRDGEWQETTDARSECTVTSAQKPVECTFEPDKGGTWRLTARVRDSRGRVNETQIRIWVAGGSRPTSRQLEREEVRLVPERERWRPGESAKVLVQAPFADAEGMATYRSGGEWVTERFAMEGTSHTLSVPIDDSQIPRLGLRVDLVGAAPRIDPAGETIESKPKRPAYATGRLDLEVSARSKTLEVGVSSESSSYRPGQEAKIVFEVKGPEGEAAPGAKLAVAVVDEAILAAADYEEPDPVEAFFPPGTSSIDVRQLRSSVRLAALEELSAKGRGGNALAKKRQPMAPAAEADRGRAAGGAAELRRGQGDGAKGIELRSDFRPVAHFEPVLRTDDEGRASLQFSLPDNVTRYRVMAVAVEGAERFGYGASSMSTRLPLRVQPSMPHFLNSGDAAQLPVVVHNQSGESRNVQLAGRARNLDLQGARGVEIEVPAGDRVEYRFPSETVDPGSARLQFVAASDGWTDATEVSLPVHTPATEEAYATYGSIEKGSVVQTVEVPEEAVLESGGLEVTTSSTALHELTDAFVYLVDSPYEGSEQIASRLLAISALRDVLGAFDAEGLPPTDELDAAVERDIEELVGRQTGDGGFAYWSGRADASPYVSVHVAHALSTAAARGAEVPEHALRRAKSYLGEVENHMPREWPPKVRRTIRAYALYTLQKMGEPEMDEMVALSEHAVGEELSLEAAGWLLSALGERDSSHSRVRELRRQIGNRVVEEAGSAHVTARYGRGAHLVMHSERRADALILEGLLRSEGANGLAPKLVEGLLGHRSKGRWSNTQENVFVLLALRRYFETFEAESPNFAADLWLGDGYVGRHEYRSRSAVKRRLEIPLDAVLGRAEARSSRFVISKGEGPGRLYYRLGMSYAPESRRLEALERGFAVERTYEPVGDSDSVRRTSDGTWRIDAGARIRVRLQMVAPSRRHHVALVDPVAAGFETLNPDVATTEPIPEDPEAERQTGKYWWWRRPWFEHQNVRRDRVEAFASTVHAGVHSYSYVVRATTPGEFIVPPPRAEEMYHPETFGRGGTDRVVVVGEDDE